MSLQFDLRSRPYSSPIVQAGLTPTDPRVKQECEVRQRTKDAEVCHLHRHHHLNWLPGICNVGFMAIGEANDRQAGHRHRIRRGICWVARVLDNSAKEGCHRSYGGVCGCAGCVRQPAKLSDGQPAIRVQGSEGAGDMCGSSSRMLFSFVFLSGISNVIQLREIEHLDACKLDKNPIHRPSSSTLTFENATAGPSPASFSAILTMTSSDQRNASTWW